MTGSKVVVRTADTNDISDLVSLRAYLIDGASDAPYTSRNEIERETWKTAYSRWIRDVHGGDNHVRIVVGDADGHIVGCATGIVDRRPPAPDCISGWGGWVQSVVVAPQWQRRGIAGRLMHELMDWFSEQSVFKIALETTPEAETFYRKLGFARSPEGLLTINGTRS